VTLLLQKKNKTFLLAVTQYFRAR